MADYEKNALGNSPTRSRTVTETVNGSHHFVIQGYSLAKGMGIGKHIAGDNFNIGGYQWAIYFYPDGKNPEDNSTYVSVFIALESEGSLECALREGAFDPRGHCTLEECTGVGYKRFYRRALLETSDYLKDDCLKINCTVGVVVSAVDCPRLQHSIRVPESDIGSHFGMLLDYMEDSDVVLNVAGEKFHAHKLVLAARPPVFRSEFFNQDGEKHYEIDLTDMEPKSELLKAVAGSEDDCSSSGGSKSRSVCGQLSEGGNTSGRRVRQRTWNHGDS
ncbi:hypothetical protein R6Q59_023639 [Mikania micrantha]